MGCAISCVLKYALMVINVVVGLAFLVIAAMGAVLIFGKDFVKTFVDELIKPILDDVVDEAKALNSLVDMILQYSTSIGAGLIVVGLLIAAVCFVGCCSACCGCGLLLKIYAAILIVLVVGQVIALIIYVSDPSIFTVFVTGHMSKTVSLYTGLKSEKGEDLLWTISMVTLNCCGFESEQDFDNTILEETLPNSAKKPEFPTACCKHKSDGSIADVTCPAAFTEANSNKGNGCKDELDHAVAQLLNIGAFVFLGIVLVELALIIITCVAICTSGKLIPV